MSVLFHFKFVCLLGLRQTKELQIQPINFGNKNKTLNSKTRSAKSALEKIVSSTQGHLNSKSAK